MLDAYVDSWVLALPGAGVAPDGYVKNLTDIFRLLEDPVVAVGITNRAAELLLSDGCFPHAGALPGNLWPHRRDVIKLVGAILERLPCIEESDLVTDIYAENISYDTSLLTQPRSKLSLEALEELVARALVRTGDGRVGEGPILITELADENNHVCEAKCDVLLIEVSGSNSEEYLGSYESQLIFAHNLHMFSRLCNPLILWNKGRFYEALRLAFHQNVIELADVPSWPIQKYKCRFGRYFLQSIRDLGFDRSEARARTLIRACTEVAAHENLGASHRIRINRGPNSEELRRERDGSPAWRRDIDYEFHLHYWLTPQGPEFSNVVVHNDFSIHSD